METNQGNKKYFSFTTMTAVKISTDTTLTHKWDIPILIAKSQEFAIWFPADLCTCRQLVLQKEDTIIAKKLLNLSHIHSPEQSWQLDRAAISLQNGKS